MGVPQIDQSLRHCLGDACHRVFERLRTCAKLLYGAALLVAFPERHAERIGKPKLVPILERRPPYCFDYAIKVADLQAGRTYIFFKMGYLLFTTIFRTKEIGRHDRQHHAGVGQCGLDAFGEVLVGLQPDIAPNRNRPQQFFHLGCEFVMKPRNPARAIVVMGIADKDVVCDTRNETHTLISNLVDATLASYACQIQVTALQPNQGAMIHETSYALKRASARSHFAREPLLPRT